LACMRLCPFMVDDKNFFSRKKRCGNVRPRVWNESLRLKPMVTYPCQLFDEQQTRKGNRRCTPIEADKKDEKVLTSQSIRFLGFLIWQSADALLVSACIAGSLVFKR